MISHILIYIITVIISGAFFVFYRDILALILFLVFLIIPLLLLLFTIIMRVCTKISIHNKSVSVNVGESATLKLIISNHSPFPITKLTVYTSHRNGFCHDADKGELSFFAPPFSKRTFDINIESKRIGNAIINFSHAKVFDYFSVFSLPISLKKQCVIPVYPSPSSLNVFLRQSEHNLDKSSVYNKFKSGEDSSEVFEIRDYVEGDSLNRVHWKLSSKLDTLMIKDYSLPENKSVLLLADLFNSSQNNTVDSIIETVFLLSYAFVEQNTPHVIGWYDCNLSGMATIDINNIDDLYTCIGLMYDNPIMLEEPKLACLSAEWQVDKSNIVYVSTDITKEQSELLCASLEEFVVLSVIEISSSKDQRQVMTAENILTTTISPSNIVEGLNNTII